MKRISIMFLIGVSAIGMISCKAQRIISTTATYTQVTDSTKVTSTINTKTTEEYVGIRKK